MSAENQHSELQELIIKKLNDELSSDETSQIDTLLLDEANMKVYDDTYILWNQSKPETIKVDPQSALSKLNNRIIENNNTSTSNLITKQPWIIAIAASVAILIGLFLFLPNNQSKQVARISIQTEHLTEVQSIPIPDGTRVDINLKSTLEYPEVFDEDTREVKLNGKAFFDVAHNKNKPFIIHTEQIDIQVLGTSFYVHSDKSGNETTVSVITGKVKLTDRINETNSIIIEKGQKGVFNNKSKVFEIVSTDVNDYFWKTKTLEFKNTSFEAVVKSINTHYNTEISVNKKLGQQAIETTFKNNTSEEIIQILQALSDCSISRNGQKIILE